MTTTDTPTAVPPIHHREAMHLAETAYDRIATVVEQLGDDDWRRPTDCEGWTVRDLVGHLVGAMESAASVRVLASEQREVARRVRAHGGNQVDHMTAVQIDRTRHLGTAELVAECRRLVPRATAGRRRMPAPVRRWASVRVQMGSIDERWTLGYLVDVILTRDAWLHRIDLCRAVGAAPVLTADHDGRIVADVAAEWGRRHGQPHHLVLTGPAGGTFGAGDGPVLELDAVEFCRIVSGRAPGTGLLATEVPF
ncbi:MAG TPA: maleylpyruvate isomerase family mycothiol-dependent enzyme [Acidimicrobiales bacterium]|nr:maleylpyruvate isomerase family mycothiol-dependent enzyme [Acidimicrobiales bacterium]